MENLYISTRIGNDDFDLFLKVVNQGIDAHLQAFTDSTFNIDEQFRLHIDIVPSEIGLFMRRLSEIADDDDNNADSWENMILESQFGIEIV